MSKARDLANAGTALTTVSVTELGYLDGVTSAVQTQLNAKQATVSGVNDTEIGYLDGVTSAIQTQLNQKPEFVAGKNKIINGDFGVWQRGTSISATNTYAYLADRWQSVCDGAITATRTAFTPGTAPVAGYENKFFLRYAKTSGTYWQIQQYIEDVQTFAGQTVTISFWAKVDAAKTIYINFTQSFGSGGSSPVTTSAGTQELTTSWARYSFTVAIPSIAGKTIGASSYLSPEIGIGPTTGNITFDIWGVQVEAGSTATAFQTATGNIQGELAACQRYFYREESSSSTSFNFGTGAYYNTTDAYLWKQFPVQMRGTPTFSSTVGSLVVWANGANKTPTGLALSQASRYGCMFHTTGITGATGGWACIFQTIATTNTILDFSAEF